MQGIRPILAVAGIAALATITIDQVSKEAVRRSLPVDADHTFDDAGWFGVAHVRNYGGAYGLIPNMPTWAPVAMTAAIGGGILAFAGKSSRPMIAGLGAGLLIGGAVGNIIDRVRQGYVTDFIRVTPAFGYFNLADVAINVGLAAAAGALLLR